MHKPPFVTAALLLSCYLTGCSQQSAGPAGTSATAGNTFQETAPGGVPMVCIPAGEFVMGDAAGDDTAPAHKVTVAAFYMDKYLVTQEVYQKITGKSPSRHEGPRNPVERVRWREAVAFCNARSQADGLKPCYDAATGKCDFSANGYRLPTETEWEYACRGGTTQTYYFGDDPRGLGAHAWFKENADRTTHPVGQWPANPFGLFDMSGDVWQWCNDWYQVDYYAHSPADNPRGPEQGEKKVLRGGGFKNKAEECTSAARNCDEPGFADAWIATDDCGFRCVRKP